MPGQIILFQRCAYASIAVLWLAELVQGNLDWPVLALCLTWLTAYHRRNSARWAYAALTIFLAGTVGWQIWKRDPFAIFEADPLILLSFLLSLMAIYFVFGRGAGAWLSGRQGNGTG